MELNPECEQVRISLDCLRGLLESLVVRGLRACGDEEIAQLRGYAEELEQADVAHVATALAELKTQLESSDRSAPQTLIRAMISVRLLDRLLTLRVAKSAYAMALEEQSDDVDNDREED